MNLDVKVQSVKDKEVLIEELRTTIKTEYTRLQVQLQESTWVVTKEIEGIYKDIERLFGKKSVLEVEVLELKKSISNELFR